MAPSPSRRVQGRNSVRQARRLWTAWATPGGKRAAPTCRNGVQSGERTTCPGASSALLQHRILQDRPPGERGDEPVRQERPEDRDGQQHLSRVPGGQVRGPRNGGDALEDERADQNGEETET